MLITSICSLFTENPYWFLVECTRGWIFWQYLEALILRVKSFNRDGKLRAVFRNACKGGRSDFLSCGVVRVTFHSSFWAACSLRILHSFPGGEQRHFILTGYTECVERQVKPDAEAFEACQLLQCSLVFSICICLNFMAPIFLVSRDSQLPSSFPVSSSTAMKKEIHLAPLAFCGIRRVTKHPA